MGLPLYKKEFKWKFYFSVQLQMIRSERKDVMYLVASAVARTCSYSCLDENASTRSVCVGFGEFWCYECFREHWSMSYWTAHAVFLSRRAVRGTLFSSDTFSTSSHLFWGFHRAKKYIVRSPPPTPDVGELSGGENQSENLKCNLLIISSIWAIIDRLGLSTFSRVFCQDATIFPPYAPVGYRLL
jgi:hypothetical protein